MTAALWVSIVMLLVAIVVLDHRIDKLVDRIEQLEHCEHWGHW
jgi:hypothetical protein